MITEDYVSFETAKLLKEKGFDEPVQMYVKVYNYPSDTVIQNIKKITGKNMEQIEVHSLFGLEDEPFFNSVEGKDESLFAYPTLQMVMKWLREVHKKHCEIYLTYRSKWSFSILDTERTIIDHDIEMDSYIIESQCTGFKSYEEASDAAIKYCLKNLI